MKGSMQMAKNDSVALAPDFALVGRCWMLEGAKHPLDVRMQGQLYDQCRVSRRME